MDLPTYIIDPEGEVILVLRNANPLFLELDEDISTDFFFQVQFESGDQSECHTEETVKVQEPKRYNVSR